MAGGKFSSQCWRSSRRIRYTTVDRNLRHVGGDGIFRFGSMILLKLPPRHYCRKSTTPKALDGVLEQCRIQFEWEKKGYLNWNNGVGEKSKEHEKQRKWKTRSRASEEPATKPRIKEQRHKQTKRLLAIILLSSGKTTSWWMKSLIETCTCKLLILLAFLPTTICATQNEARWDCDFCKHFEIAAAAEEWWISAHELGSHASR